MFRIEFTTENDAFHPNGRMEVTAILREVTALVDRGRTSGSVRDSNGNNIGSWDLHFPEDNT